MSTQINQLFDKYLIEIYEDEKKYYDFLDDLNTCDANPEDSPEYTGPILQKALNLKHALERELVNTNPDRILSFSEHCTTAYRELCYEIEPESVENIVKSFQKYYTKCVTYFVKMNV